jgi:murein DD-endopeptidase MepM/ murein hydrolase activator NlpD
LGACGGADNTAQADEQEEQPESQAESLTLYGIPADGFEIIEATIEPNQFLADILLPFGVEYRLIDRIARDREVFDVRRMRAGQPYSILAERDSAGLKARYFIYEQDKVDYVVFEFLEDSVVTRRDQKEIERRQREVAGVINSSLYQTLVDAGAHPYLVNKLEDVYAWSIDFYRIQVGDQFKAIYDELYVDGERIGIDSLRAAWFKYRGTEFYAVHFNQDGLGSYYDPEGNSLQKAFLQAPLKYSRISSRYSKRRFHPVLKRYKSHLGTDYAAPTGTPIRTTGNGTVIAASYTKGNGNYVKIRHNSLYTTQYLHMSRFAEGVRKGVTVKQGQIIGYVGSTGLATGPHLCYRFWKNGTQVDPFLEKLPPAFPVKKERKSEYDRLRDRMIDELDAIALPDTDSLRLSSEVEEALDSDMISLLMAIP